MKHYNNTDYQVLTDTGFQDFEGIRKLSGRDIIILEFSDKTKLECTPSHKIKTENGEFSEALYLNIGDLICTDSGFVVISDINFKKEKSDVFDLIGVSGGNSYITNNVVSHNCEFLGSEETLISGPKLRQLAYKTPLSDDGKGLKIYERPDAKRNYVATVDTSEGNRGDACAISVFDISEVPYRQVAAYKNNDISIYVFPTILHQLATMYNEAFVLVETMSTGKQVVDMLRLDLEYENIIMVDSNQKRGQNIGGGFKKTATFGLKTNKATKKIGCMNLKSLIEQDKLLVVDFDTINELYSFILKNDTYKAEEGKNDDMAMTLVLFAWTTAQKYFTDLTDLNVRDAFMENFSSEMYEELTPVGFFDDGRPSETGVSEGGDIWHSVEPSGIF